MRWSFALIIATMLPSTLMGQDTSVDIPKSPLLAAEFCFAHSPHTVRTELEKAGWIGCETCVDGMMALYAERVRPLVDARCAGVANARDDLHKAIESFDRAFQVVTDGNWFGHESERHAAVVEWMMIETAGASTGAVKDVCYTHDDLRGVMLLWYRTHQLDPDAAKAKQTTYSDCISTALAALRRAEAKLTPQQTAQLRQLIMRRIAGWL